MQTKLSIRGLLALIGVVSSRFYGWKKKLLYPKGRKIVPKSHWLLPEEVKAIVSYKWNHPTCGYRLLTWMMIDENVCCSSPSSVLRVLTLNGLNTKWTNERFPERKKGFKQPSHIHHHWHIDIAYVNVFGTFMYLITVLDGYSRMVLAWGLRPKMEEQDVAQILYNATEKYPDAKPALISDNGGQFISFEYKSMVKKMGLTPRYISPGHPQSNGKIERWHRTIKENEIRVNPYTGPNHAIKKIGEWIDWYNNHRLHSAIGYLPPIVVFNGKGAERKAERIKKIDDAKQQRKIGNRKLTA